MQRERLVHLLHPVIIRNLVTNFWEVMYSSYKFHMYASYDRHTKVIEVWHDIFLYTENRLSPFLQQGSLL